MRTSITITSSLVTHVYRADLDETSKVVRTLVVHPDLAAEVRLLPVHADEQRLVGLELSVQGLDPKWLALDQPTPWKAGSVPVALTDKGSLVFCTLRDLRQERLRWLADQVSCAFQDDQDHSLLHRVATLEHADGVLGGHALTSGALLLLAEEHPDAPEIGGFARLRSRFHANAPDGLPTLQRELSRPAIQQALSSRLADRIVGAARRAAQPNGVFTADAWAACGERTLWSWWVHWKAGAADVPLRELARRLDMTAHDLMVLAKAEALPHEVGVQDKLPPREVVVRDLDGSLGTQPRRRARVAFTQRAHQARLGLFVRQTSQLERVFAEDRLTRWANVRDILRAVRESLQLRSFQHQWEAAEFTSEELLENLQRGDGAHSVASLVHDLGGILAGTVLPFGRQQGAWHVEPDGAPVLFLTPAALNLSGGARRFAVLHQLGHLVAGHDRGCTKWADDTGYAENAPEEQFANAFAAYLAAPRHAVQGLVGRPQAVTDEWLKAASRDVAIEFGLGPDAALPHLLNCLEESVRHWQTRMASWHPWRSEVTAQVADRWSADTGQIFAACGGVDSTTVQEAIGRPHSPVYEGLMRRAADDDQVPSELLTAYGL